MSHISTNPGNGFSEPSSLSEPPTGRRTRHLPSSVQAFAIVGPRWLCDGRSPLGEGPTASPDLRSTTTRTVSVDHAAGSTSPSVAEGLSGRRGRTELNQEASKDPSERALHRACARGRTWTGRTGATRGRFGRGPSLTSIRRRVKSYGHSEIWSPATNALCSVASRSGNRAEPATTGCKVGGMGKPYGGYDERARNTSLRCETPSWERRSRRSSPVRARRLINDGRTKCESCRMRRIPPSIRRCVAMTCEVRRGLRSMVRRRVNGR